jgi:aspartate ammonia-lyase
MTDYRVERDLLGEREVPADALWGVETLRARENFPLAGRPVRKELVRAYGAVKLACARMNHELGRWDERTFSAIGAACEEMIAGDLDDHVVVDALQGGAGTSTNMNVNEVLANRALQHLGRGPGEYGMISPHEDINRHQSTNDTYPTALRVAGIGLLRRLEERVVGLLEAFQGKEKEFADVVKVGRTQMQDAVLTTVGRAMGAYAEAFARDRWRLYKCEERLRVVNLGGTAIGTGLGAPRAFVFGAVEHLRAITGYGLARAENLIEATQNADVYVEVHGLARTLAVNLLKVAGDLRLLSSGPEAGLGELRLPAVQPGSSIMPGKVNPVVPEAVSQAAMRVMGNDVTVAQASAGGSLELNPFGPLIADCLLESLGLLGSACEVFRTSCVEGLEVDATRCRAHVDGSSATLTAMVETIGYQRATELARRARQEGRSIHHVVLAEGLMPEAELDAAISAERVTQLGSRPTDDDSR